MKIPSVALIGAGSRGKGAYGEFVINHSKLLRFVAVVEPQEQRRELFGQEHGISDAYRFEDTDTFFAAGKLADAVVVANLDKQHYAATMQAMDLGYDILLEKPISPNLMECMALEAKARETGTRIMVCHVLRYTPFFSKIKALVERGDIGDIVHINHTENIGNFHYAHSFVRGNWRNSVASSPLILAKSCHDMDILTWLANSKALNIASFGDQRFFKKEHAPNQSGEWCHACSIASQCDYNGVENYRQTLGQWPTSMIDDSGRPDRLKEKLKKTTYGRCVWKIDDHDVCDHQVTLIGFENGVKATFTLTAFSNKVYREIRIHGTHGIIEADDLSKQIRVNHFVGYNQQAYKTVVYHPEDVPGGHNGGDTGLMFDFCHMLTQPDLGTKTSIEHSLESHLMCFAAEEARLTSKVVNISEFKKNIGK